MLAYAHTGASQTSLSRECVRLWLGLCVCVCARAPRARACVCDQSLPHTHPPRSGEGSAQADTPNSTTVTSLNWLNASGPSLLSVASDDGVVRVWGGLMETDSSRWVRWSGRALAAYPSGVRVEVNAMQTDQFLLSILVLQHGLGGCDNARTS